jgi:hypothetical protein
LSFFLRACFRVFAFNRYLTAKDVKKARRARSFSRSPKNFFLPFARKYVECRSPISFTEQGRQALPQNLGFLIFRIRGFLILRPDFSDKPSVVEQAVNAKGRNQSGYL